MILGYGWALTAHHNVHENAAVKARMLVEDL